MEEIQQNSINEWARYLASMHNRHIEMNNMIAYNQFVNEEVRRLQRKVRFLTDDIKTRDTINNRLKKENEILLTKNNELNSKNYSLKRKRKRENKINIDNDYINNIIVKKPRKYRYITKKNRDNKIKELFKSFKSIKDIIMLKNSKYMYDFIRNDKYYKLLKLVPILEKIDNIIGMENIKKEVYNMICYYIHNLHNSKELNHIVITGQPGVGKTTLAKYLGELYCSLGFLKNKTFTKAKRSDLIAEYLGQTAIKTQKVIDSAEGGVLFIDEVYSLGNRKNDDMYAKECIDTININLTEKSDKLLVIIAGYKEDINTCFFNYNRGLERRFSLRFDISAYKYNELFDIFKKFVSDSNYELSDKITNELIKKNYEYFKSGMAGDMMTLLKYAKEDFSKTLMKNIIDNNEIVKEISLKNMLFAIKKMKNIKEQNMDKIPEWYMNMLC